MHWYDGTIAEAVALSKQRNAIFVVFIEGDNDLSAEMATTIDSADVLKRLAEPKHFLAIKLMSGSTNYIHFAQIYQFVPVPSLFFIGRNGTPLEVVCAGVEPSNLATRIDRILQQHLKDKTGVHGSPSSENLKQQTADLLSAEASQPGPAGKSGLKMDHAQPETSSEPPSKVQKTDHVMTKSGKEYDVVCDGDVCTRVARVAPGQPGPSSANVVIHEPQQKMEDLLLPTEVPKKRSESPKPMETSKTPPQAPKKSSPAPKESSQGPKESTPAPKEPSPGPKESSPAPKEPSQGPKESSPAPEEPSEAPKEHPEEDSSRAIDIKMAKELALKKIMEEKRIEKAAKEKEMEIQKELERRSVGQGVNELKQWQADQELKQLQEERKREKMENNLARQRILEQIAQDRAERKARDQPVVAQPVLVQPNVSHPPNTAGDAHAGMRARIQFKLPDGASHTAHFDATGTLADVHLYVAENLQLSTSSFSLWTAFPRRELTQPGATLRTLQLTPSAALLVLPRRTPNSVASPSSFASLFTFLTQVFTTLILDPSQQLFAWLRARLLGDTPPPPAEAPPRAPYEPELRAPQGGPLRRRGNIHRLGEGKSPDDDNNTWNGNSTQQM